MPWVKLSELSSFLRPIDRVEVTARFTKAFKLKTEKKSSSKKKNKSEAPKLDLKIY
jgi:hypothetical protein